MHRCHTVRFHSFEGLNRCDGLGQCNWNSRRAAVDYKITKGGLIFFLDSLLFIDIRFIDAYIIFIFNQAAGRTHARHSYPSVPMVPTVPKINNSSSKHNYIGIETSPNEL